MDFMTALAYWAIAILSIVNGIVVLMMKVDIGDK